MSLLKNRQSFSFRLKHNNPTIQQSDYTTIGLSNHIIWDGKDSENRILPCGVYFVALQAGNYSTTEKLLLTK